MSRKPGAAPPVETAAARAHLPAVTRGSFTPLLAGLLACAALAACGRGREIPPASTDAPPPLTDRVRVVDAQSLVIDGQRVRVSNIDAPELFPGARCWAEAVLAKQAFFTVLETVQQGQDVQLRPEGRQNRWGQALAGVEVDGVDLGDLLYQQGLASRPTGRRFDWCGELQTHAPGAPTLDPLFADGRR